jgi:hypothetical protein
MSNCIKYQEMISCYIDGELSESETADLMSHIDSCPSCRSLLEIYKSCHEAYSGEGVMEEPPEKLLSGVMASIRASNAVVSDTSVPSNAIPFTKKKSKSKNILIAFAALAACIAIVLLSFPSLLRFDIGTADNAASSEVTADSAMPESAEQSSKNESATTYDASTSLEDSANKAEDTTSSATDGESNQNQSEGDADTNSDTTYYATVTINGTLPDNLSESDFEPQADGTYTMTVSASIADELSAAGYEVSYTGLSTEECDTALIVWSPES